MKKRIFAALCATVIAVAQVFVLLPCISFAGGNELTVYVQYFGDRGDKVKPKAKFSRNQLEGMGPATYCYSNLTNVSTVMVIKARGPKLTTIISKAGIDMGSVQNITFKTDDGYTRNFSGSKVVASGYYYPKLNLYTRAEKPEEPTEPVDPENPDVPEKPDDPVQPGEQDETTGDRGVLERLGVVEAVNASDDDEWILNYIKNSDGKTITPRKGSLEGATKVPAILALEFGSTKTPGHDGSDLKMSKSQTYRFCIGQTKLTEGKSTKPGYSGGDVTSADSCHSISGVYVTLYGSPVKGIKLTVDNLSTKVGSKKKIKATIRGDKLFSEYLNVKNLKWKSSDTEIATVDQNGNVTIKAKGTVVITATAPDGTSASITLGGKAGESGAKDAAEGKRAAGDVIMAREISLGAEIKPEKITAEEAAQMQAEEARAEMASDAQELGETEQYDPRVAAGSAAFAAAACSFGAVFRIRRFRIDR